MESMQTANQKLNESCASSQFRVRIDFQTTWLIPMTLFARFNAFYKYTYTCVSIATRSLCYGRNNSIAEYMKRKRNQFCAVFLVRKTTKSSQSATKSNKIREKVLALPSNRWQVLLRFRISWWIYYLLLFRYDCWNRIQLSGDSICNWLKYIFFSLEWNIE